MPEQDIPQTGTLSNQDYSADNNHITLFAQEYLVNKPEAQPLTPYAGLLRVNLPASIKSVSHVGRNSLLAKLPNTHPPSKYV